MEQLKWYILLLVSNCFCLPLILAVSSGDFVLPKARIMTQNDKLNEFELVNTTDSQTTMEKGRNALFQCEASYPVQWVYSGNGAPSLSTNTSSIQNETHIVYKATSFVQRLTELHTGLYKCGSTEYPQVFNSFYIFVPGPALFTSAKGKKIYYSILDSQVRIPCSVSNPNATVYLKKSIENILQSPFNSSIATYNPKHGFDLNLQEIENIEGVYVCAASYENHFRVVEFTLEATDKGDIQLQSSNICSSDSQCPYSMTCSSRRRCESPCKNRCEVEEYCEVRNHKPVCLQQQMSSRSPVPSFDHTSPSPCRLFHCSSQEYCRVVNGLPMCVCRAGHIDGCTVWCNSNQDCPKHQRCIQKVHQNNGYSQTCINRCEGYVCGSNSDCEHEVNGTAKCVCKIGYVGDGDSGCTRPTTPPPIARFYCQPSHCGPHGQCQIKDGKSVCACQRGAVGTPPNCELSCGSNEDCPLSKACSLEGECYNICNGNQCGKQAICRVLKRAAVCYCPPGYGGDPNVACYSNHFLNPILTASSNSTLHPAVLY